MKTKTKSADALERGDVINWHGQRVVVLEPSDHVTSAPPDEIFNGLPAFRCCEPRIGYLGRTGRLTHRVTYIIVPNRRRFEVKGFLDLDIPSAVPELV
jgi:hypothetical protein